MCHHSAADRAEGVFFYYRMGRGIVTTRADRGIARTAIPGRCRWCPTQHPTPCEICGGDDRGQHIAPCPHWR